MFNKIREMFSNPGDPGLALYWTIPITVLIIVSLVFDFLKCTAVYENNVMKHILNTNYWLSYSLGLATKIMFISILIIQLSKRSPEEDNLHHVNNGLIISVMLASIIFEFIMFTPLMNNKYINQIVSLNSSLTFGISIFIKFIALLNVNYIHRLPTKFIDVVSGLMFDYYPDTTLDVDDISDPFNISRFN
jgi:hypothetical protein